MYLIVLDQLCFTSYFLIGWFSCS